MDRKRIVFLTGTRADFGKLKSLIEVTSKSQEYDVHIFATGMHINSRYGRTVDEIFKCGYKNIYMFVNQSDFDTMDRVLAKTIMGFSDYIKEIMPDLIVIHGDRVEALAGAIVGALNNILVAHIEGGEVSGTVDELIRHAVTKLSHAHFVGNDIARKRILQMGECSGSIFVIGSPDIDIMSSKDLPSIDSVKENYGIKFRDYAILLFHPVTTEISRLKQHIKEVVDAVLDPRHNYIVIYPNNDLGSNIIFEEYVRLEGNERIKIFPSIRFEYFLVLIKNARFVLGNSSAGVIEAPYYCVPAVNIGTRQHRRVLHDKVINCSYDRDEILDAIERASSMKFEKVAYFGDGESDRKFYDVLAGEEFWKISKQKHFRDLD